MSSQEDRRSLHKVFVEIQQKFVYYIIALCVAAIGFSIIQTTGKSLDWFKLPVGLAVLFWALSIVCGLHQVLYVLSNTYANLEQLIIADGLNPSVGNNPIAIIGATEGIKKAMESNSNKAGKYFKWQRRFFYFGVASFLIWHILEMAQV